MRLLRFSGRAGRDGICRRKSGGGGDDFDVAFLADDEGVSVTFTILFPPSQP